MSFASSLDREIRSFEITLSSLAEIAVPTVFVIEGDHPSQDTLGSLIRDFGWRADTYASAEQFLSRPAITGPSCLVLDVTTPGLNGPYLQRRIAADRSSMPIILVSGGGDVLMTVHASGGGFAQSIIPPFAPLVADDGLLSTIERCIAWSEMAIGDEAEVRTLRERHASLSSRERQVMVRVVAGLQNKQIGRELGITEITVKVHRGRAMQKMEAGSLADFVRMAGSLRLTRHDGSIAADQQIAVGMGRLN